MPETAISRETRSSNGLRSLGYFMFLLGLLTLITLCVTCVIFFNLSSNVENHGRLIFWVSALAVASLLVHGGMARYLYSEYRKARSRGERQLLAQAELSESRAMFQQLFEQNDFPTVVLDPSGMIVATNTMFEQIFGAASGGGADRFGIFADPRFQTAETHNALATVNAERRPCRWVLDVVSKQLQPGGDGGSPYAMRSFQCLAFPIEAPSGDLVGVGLMCVDVTDRRRAERERSVLAGAVEQAEEAVVIADRTGCVRYANAVFERWAGRPRDRLIGYSVEMLEEGDERDLIWMPLRRAMDVNAGFQESLKLKIGEPPADRELDLDASISLVRDDDGRITHFAAFYRNVTREHQLTRQLEQSQKAESLGRLVGTVAHDFNNLLTGIMSYADLAASAASLENRDDLHQIKEIAERARTLTGQLLRFSRKEESAAKTFPIAEVIEKSRSILDRLIGEDIRVTYSAPEDSWIVRMDPLHLEQVLMNLAVNARDAMPAGGNLDISVSHRVIENPEKRPWSSLRPGRYALLEIRDNGSGIPEAIQGKIFEPLFTTKSPDRGTGLGLSTVLGIVRQWGGHIDFESEQGRGTVFRVYLPRSERLRVAEPAAEAVVIPKSGEDAAVLLVEDEPVVRSLAKRILTEAGYSVTASAGPEEALSLASDPENVFDILLTDVVMPGMNGRELADAAVAVRPDLAVVFMSGYTDNIMETHGVVATGVRFLAKPFSPHQLRTEIREALDESRLTTSRSAQVG